MHRTQKIASYIQTTFSQIHFKRGAVDVYCVTRGPRVSRLQVPVARASARFERPWHPQPCRCLQHHDAGLAPHRASSRKLRHASRRSRLSQRALGRPLGAASRLSRAARAGPSGDCRPARGSSHGRRYRRAGKPKLTTIALLKSDPYENPCKI